MLPSLGRIVLYRDELNEVSPGIVTATGATEDDEITLTVFSARFAHGSKSLTAHEDDQEVNLAPVGKLNRWFWPQRVP